MKKVKATKGDGLEMISVSPQVAARGESRRSMNTPTSGRQPNEVSARKDVPGALVNETTTDPKKTPLIKISDEGPPVDTPFNGRYRDSKGGVLHGVYVRRHKRTEEKLFISNGNLMRLYRYPTIERRFSSPLVNDHNLHLCGGWTFPGVEKVECLTRVVGGKKPMGFLTTFDETYFKHMSGLLERTDLDGFKWTTTVEPWRFSNDCRNVFEIGLAMDTSFDHAFDMGALSEDYSDYLAAWGFPESVTDEVQQTLSELREQRPSDFLGGFDYANPDNPRELVITGLALGYPIETTVDLLKAA